MQMDRPVKIVLAAAMLGVLVVGLAAGSLAQGSKAGPILKPNPEMDKRTVIAPSTIPGAGNGLFARVRIKKGDVIGELGGQLITELNGSQYVAWLPGPGRSNRAPEQPSSQYSATRSCPSVATRWRSTSSCEPMVPRASWDSLETRA
jgi:hypothetical protein